MSTDKVAEAIQLEKATAFQEPANTKPEDKDEEDAKMSFIQKLKMKRKKQKEAQMIPFFKLVSSKNTGPFKYLYSENSN